MARFTDGTFSTPSLNGARKRSLPLRNSQDFVSAQYDWKLIGTAEAYDTILDQRTAWVQLLTYSDDVSNAAWTKTNLGTLATQITDPEGNTTAWKLPETTTNAAHGISQVTVVASGALTFGVFVKAGERTAVRLRFNNGTDGSFGITDFDLSGSGAVVAGVGSIGIKHNGWFWCKTTGTATVANSTCVVEIGSNTTTFSYAGTTGSGLYVWRATCYAGSSASTALVSTAGPAIFATSATRSVTAPPVDPLDACAFLVDESPADEGNLKLGMAEWSRTYAVIPQENVIPSSIIVAKPDIPKTGIQINSYVSNSTLQDIVGLCYFLNTSTPSVLAFQSNISIPTWDLYRMVAATGDSGPISGAINVTGGTYTLSFRGVATASINYNDVAATVATRLNANSYITALGGVTVAGSYTAGFLVTWATLGAATLGTGSLTGTFTSSVQTNNAGYLQIITIGGGVASGTYTVTILGQTTAAINYNASISAISSAINALTNVIAAGGCTITGVGFLGGIINFMVQFIQPLITGVSTALTPPSSSVLAASGVLVVNSVQTVFLYGATFRTVTVPSHGFQVGDTIVVAGNNVAGYLYPGLAYFDITVFSIIDSNTIGLTVQGTSLWSQLPVVTMLGVKRVTNYQPAPINTRCNVITDYYLPGFSPGIPTAASIPLPTPQSDPVSFISALVLGGTLNYEVGDMAVWMGPILSVTKKTVNVADLGVSLIYVT